MLPPDEIPEGISLVQSASARTAQSAGSPDEWRLRPAPVDSGEMLPVAQAAAFASRSAARGLTRRASSRAAEADTGAPEEYRLSEPPAPVTADVAVAQGYSPSQQRPRPRGGSRSMAVVEIASAIAGATMSRVLDNEGDVHWELDQLNGAAHPDGATTTPSTANWTPVTVPVAGFWIENNIGQRTAADFEITFQQNGASVGYIQVSPTHADDGWGDGVSVKENIMADPNTYISKKLGGARVAGVKVRFVYRFEHIYQDDAIGITELTLFGDGTYSMSARWTQAP